MEDFAELVQNYSEALEKTLSANNKLKDVLKDLMPAREALKEILSVASKNMCPVCTERKQVRSLSCGHVFCNACAGRVMGEQSPKCPICRASIVRTFRVYLD